VLLEADSEGPRSRPIDTHLMLNAGEDPLPLCPLCLRLRPNLCAAAIRRFVPILLQKSKVAGLGIFRENSTRELIADSYAFNHVTEVAREFFVRR
jgi:hypothetical protein